MRAYWFVAIGGGVGTLIRTGISTLYPLAHGFHTVWINIIGSFLLAMLFTLMPAHNDRMRSLRLLLGTGLLGGFTTMSTFSLDIVKLLAGNEWAIAAIVVCASIVGGLLASACGFWLGRKLRGENA